MSAYCFMFVLIPSITNRYWFPVINFVCYLQNVRFKRFLSGVVFSYQCVNVAFECYLVKRSPDEKHPDIKPKVMAT